MKKVEIIGNKNLRKREVLSIMDLSPRFLKKTPSFAKKYLFSDIEEIENFYKGNGFLSVKIESEVIPDSIRKEVIIKIKIEEGEKYRISKVKILGEDSSLLTRNKFLCKEGEIFKISSLEHDRKIIKEWYGKRGYLFSEVTAEYIIDTTDASVNINFTIDKGKLALIDSISINGNSKIKKDIIRRELKFKKNDTLTTDKISKTEYNLYRTELISSVNIEAQLDSSNKEKNQEKDSLLNYLCYVNVNLRESHFFHLKLGAGYGSDEGFRGTLETSKRNFLSIGHKIAFKGKISQNLQEAKGVYSIPWLFNIPVTFNSSLYYTRYSNKETYRGLLRGILLSFEYSFDFPLTFLLWTKFDDVLWISSIELPKEVPLKNTQSIGIDLTFDKRDNILDPSTGFYSLFKTEAAGLTGINSNQFLKLTTDIKVYWEYKMFRLASGVTCGWIRPYDKDVEVPLQERFFAGGSKSVRGFRENFLLSIKDSTLHPKSGTFMITSNIIEIRFPILWIIGGALFLDAGLLSEDIKNKDVKTLTKEIRWAAGPGIRINTPIAIFRLDMGFKLNKRYYEDLFQIHLDVGQSF